MPEPISRYRRWLTPIGLAIVLAILGWQIKSWQATTNLAPPVDDFVEYWAAGRLFLAGVDPYAPQPLFDLQLKVGWDESQPLMMWNPPWVLPFVIPFALLPYPTARTAWLVLSVLLALLNGSLLWRFYRPQDHRPWPGWLLALCFAPTLFVLGIGQIAPLILTGWVGFLWCERRRRDLLAGACLVVVAIKPHLFFLIWPVLLWWTWHGRRWRILIGLAGILALLTGALMIHSALLPFHYYFAVTTAPPLYWATPTLGAWLRRLFGVDRLWLQFVPSVAGLLVTLVLLRRQRGELTWSGAGSLLLLLSLNTTWFGWSFDQMVLLPALCRSTVNAINRSDRWKWAWLAIFALLQATAITQRVIYPDDAWFLWLAPAWLLLYIIAE